MIVNCVGVGVDINISGQVWTYKVHVITKDWGDSVLCEEENEGIS